MHAVDEKERRFPSRLEVAVFIEDTVVGQVMLVVRAIQFAFMNNSCRVINIVVAIDKANYRGQAREKRGWPR